MSWRRKRREKKIQHIYEFGRKKKFHSFGIRMQGTVSYRIAIRLIGQARSSGMNECYSEMKIAKRTNKKKIKQITIHN